MRGSSQIADNCNSIDYNGPMGHRTSTQQTAQDDLYEAKSQPLYSGPTQGVNEACKANLSVLRVLTVEPRLHPTKQICSVCGQVSSAHLSGKCKVCRKELCPTCKKPLTRTFRTANPKGECSYCKRKSLDRLATRRFVPEGV